MVHNILMCFSVSNFQESACISNFLPDIQAYLKILFFSISVDGFKYNLFIENIDIIRSKNLPSPFPLHSPYKNQFSTVPPKFKIFRNKTSAYLNQYYKLFKNYIYCKHTAEKAMATHSSTLAWKIPWTEEPGRLQSMGSLPGRHD